MSSIPMQLLRAFIIGTIFATHLSGCGFVHDEKITGPYRLAAVDISEQMSICYALDKDNCIGRIPETVFSIGWNERFIVAKQHPLSNGSVTNYFILDMSQDSKFADPGLSVMGPLSAATFEEKKTMLGLPPFMKTIEALN